MDTEDRAFWLSWCIEEYAEVLHTQGKSYILDCIEKFMQNSNG